MHGVEWLAEILVFVQSLWCRVCLSVLLTDFVVMVWFDDELVMVVWFGEVAWCVDGLVKCLGVLMVWFGDGLVKNGGSILVV